MALISRATGSVLFRGLSSFWSRLFRDSSVYDALYSATEAALGDVYLDLMEAVLSKSLRNTPVFSKRDWRLLLLKNQDLSFDPAVYSYATSRALGVPITLTALDLSPSRDNVSVELSDAKNLSTANQILYPTHGIFNQALATGDPTHESIWTVRVPAGQNIAASVAAISQRLVSQRRLTSFNIGTEPDVSGFSYAVRSSLVSLGSWDAGADSPVLPDPSTLAPGSYYQVSASGTTSVNGVSTWVTGDLVVSDGTQWQRAQAETPTLLFKYGPVISNPVVLPGGAYGSASALAVALQAAITATNLTMKTQMNLTITVDGGYLVISSDQPLFLWQTNTAAEHQLFLKEFRYQLTAAVPPGRQSQFPWNQTGPIQLQTSGYSPAGTEYRFPVDPSVVDAKYLYSALYEPTVILERPRHFRLENGFIYFKDNPFGLENLTFRDFGGGARQIALWMSDVSIDRLDLYYNYGYRYTNVHASSEAYKNFLQGVYYYYTHGPQVARVVSALNLIAGLPVASGSGEVVLSVDPAGLTVTTDQNTYMFPANTPATVSVGQVLEPFDAMTSAFAVEDYINTPDWYNNFVVPSYLIPDAPLGFRLSTAVTFIPLVGDPGFLVGDTIPGAQELDTNTIAPQSSSDYALTGDAFFVIEKDKNGVQYPVYVPASMTLGAQTLSDMAAYLLRASMQLYGNPVNGAGGNPYQLLTPAKFTVLYLGTSYNLTVTPAMTAAVASLAALATVVQSVFDGALGAGAVQVYPYLVAGNLVFIPGTASPLAFSQLNVSASTELGISPASSLSGVTVQQVQQSYLAFLSRTTGSSAFLAITQMNDVALNSLSMTPFRTGSGEFFGTSGDPSPGWTVMDTYLKYNTFRVKYNPAAITLEAGAPSISAIVASGRPLYTAPIILPEFQLQDVVTTTGLQVTDLDALPVLTGGQPELVDRTLARKAAVYLDTPVGIFWRQDGTPDDPQRYIYYYSVSAVLDVSGISPDTGALVFTSTTPGLRDTNHLIQVTDLNSVLPDDVNAFNTVGVFNRGKAVGGVSFLARQLGAGTVGGVYPSDPTGVINGQHWVQGFDKASFAAAATHVLVIDAGMKTSGFDPFSAGVTAGDFMTLKNFSDAKNNGTFAVLNVFRNTQFLGQHDSHGNPVLVDILTYRNNHDTVTTPENYLRSTVPPFATVSFRAKGSLLSNQWLVVLPGTGTVAAQIAAVQASTVDDKAVFPFTITYTDGAWTPPSGAYYGGLTSDGDSGKETFYGDLYKISWDINPAHGDDEAQGIYTPGSYSSEAFIIGDPQVFLQDFTSGMDAALYQALTFKGLWNAQTDNPVIPAPTSVTFGWYYFVNFPGTTTVGANSSWSIGDWLVSDGTQWLQLTRVPHQRIVAFPVPHFGYEQASVTGTIGGTGSTWGEEGYPADLDPVGSYSHTSGWSLGNDAFGQPLYVGYNHTVKVNTNFLSYGEVAFWKSLKAYFNPTPPGDDRSEYLGPTVFPSDQFQGYFDAASNRASSYVTLPKSMIQNLPESVLQVLSYAGTWNAQTNSPAIPTPVLSTKGQYYQVSVSGTSVINGHTNWAEGEYFVSDGTQWVYCSAAGISGYGLFYPEPSALSTALSPGGSLGDIYQVVSAWNVPIAGITADVQAGHQLFEVGDWLSWNGLAWVRVRSTSSYGERASVIARRPIQESPWPLIPPGAPGLSGGSDSLAFGLSLQPEVSVAMIPSTDANAGVIGAGAPSTDTTGVDTPAGYVIGGTSLWTGLIGPFEGDGYIGDFEASMGYVLSLEATAFSGYGASALNSSTFVDTAQTKIESSGVFNWASDNSVTPANAVCRVYNGGGFFTLYVQVPETSLDVSLGGQGVTIELASAGSLLSISNAVRVLYFDGTSWGSTPSQVNFSSGTVTGTTLTLLVQPNGQGGVSAFLWNGTDTSVTPNAESAPVSPTLYAGHTPGLVLVAITVDASHAGSFGQTSSWVSGVLFHRTLLT